MLRRSGRLKKRPKVTRDELEARALVSARSGVCECCGTARATDWHHRKNRSQGGIWSASNGLGLCRECHMDVTDSWGDRRKYYRETGVIVLSHEDPFTVPVNTPHTAAKYLGPVHLSDCGGVWPADLEPITGYEEGGSDE